MKKIYWIAFFMIGLAVYLLMTAADDMSTYSTFKQAIESKEKVKVVGQLAKDKLMHYDPVKDPNYFSFYVKDNDGTIKKVVLHSEKPQDFERSEQIVLTGEMQNDEFIASEILLKCPSKYQDEEVIVKSKQK